MHCICVYYNAYAFLYTEVAAVKKKPIGILWPLFSRKVMSKPSAEQEPGVSVREKKFYAALEKVRGEWQTANSFFNLASEPQQIDLAVEAMAAAERKHMLLLKRGRRLGYRIPAAMKSLEGRRGL